MRRIGAAAAALLVIVLVYFASGKNLGASCPALDGSELGDQARVTVPQAGDSCKEWRSRSNVIYATKNGKEECSALVREGNSACVEFFAPGAPSPVFKEGCSCSEWDHRAEFMCAKRDWRGRCLAWEGGCRTRGPDGGCPEEASVLARCVNYHCPKGR